MKDRSAQNAAFRFEQDMLPSAQRWLYRQGLLVKREFYTPWGVCDLVGVSLNGQRVKERLSFGQKRPIGPLIRVEILNSIPDVKEGQFATLEGLEAEYEGFIDASQIRAAVENLMRNKFIVASAKGGLQKLNGWAPLHSRIVALELKLNRVEEVLDQAASHLAFAEESYTGLPAGLAERIAESPRAARFRSEGVGILSVGRNRCKVVLPPDARRGPKDLALQMHCVERFWRTRT